MNICVCSDASAWLAQRPEGQWGWLVGLRATQTIVTSGVVSVGADAYISEVDDLWELVPAGLSVIGVFTSTASGGDVGEEGRRLLSERASLLSQVHVDGVLGAAAGRAVVAVVSEGVVSLGVVGSAGGPVEPVQAEARTRDQWRSEVAMLRVHTSLSWAMGAEGGREAALEHAIDGLKRELCSQRAAFVAAAPASSVGKPTGKGAEADNTIVITAASSPSSPSCGALGGVGKEPPAEITPLTLQSTAPAGGLGQSPVLDFSAAGGGSGHMPARGQVDVDLVCYAPAGLPTHEAVARFILPGLKRQLQAMRANLAAAPSPSSPAVTSVRAVHFQLAGWPHVVSAAYVLPQRPAAEDEQTLEPKRRSMHHRLGLPLDRPMLRLSSAISFGQLPMAVGAAAATPRLKNVHEGLSPSPVVGGEQSLVFGTYEYFHYMQDRFDDNGWGCAYRSLQTIVSWFRLQHYTMAPVPSHREIQQALVGIGDKPASFAGSSQWIGAIELGMILDALLGVSYKVMALSSGADIPTKGRELALHFRTQGTPVMIGGGLLAYTLLGVDFNERTGDVAFLILDPHYTGGEDLKTIQGQRWVGWKRGPTADGPGDIFDRNSFYNLLMPQRPSQI